MCTLTCIVGLPASGKSTYAGQLANKINSTVFSSDSLRNEMFGDIYDQSHNQQIFQELHKRIKACLHNNNNAIMDCTNISSKRRRAFLNELKKIDCIKNCVIIATPYEQCLKNNRDRARQVPEWAIERMYRKWQTPHWFEGWDNVTIEYWDDKHFVWPIHVAESLLDFDQHNPHHTKTLGGHLFSTSRLCNIDNFDDADAYRILNAALIHDCGKPFCQTFKNAKGEPSEIAHYYNHEHVSAYEALFILPVYEEDIIETINISALVTWHMQPYFFERNNNEKLHNKYKRIWGEKFYSQIMCLHEADKAAH